MDKAPTGPAVDPSFTVVPSSAAGEPVERFRGYPVDALRVEVAGRVLELLRPANYEKLLDDPRVIERFRQDEYMPYWAEFWPAARLLADEVAAWGRVGTWEGGNVGTETAAGSPPTVLELGCGLGVVGLIAHALGYPTIISDYDEDALAFVAENARRNGLPPPVTRFIDWRKIYDDLRVDRILGADILYEPRHVGPVAEFISQHLNPGGFALLGDANRSVANLFTEHALRCGLAVEIQAVEKTIAGQPRPLRGRLFRLRTRRV